MPIVYTKRFSARRRRRFRRYNRRQPRTLAKAVKRQVNRMAETKRLQKAYDLAVASSPALILQLLQVPQGTGEGQRVGDHITLQKVMLRWQITAADNTNTVRFILFQWKQYTGPAGTDILNLTAPDFSALPFIAPYNVLTDSSYKILMDRTYTVDADDPVIRTQKLIYKGILQKINFQNAAGTSSVYNQLYLLVVSDSGATSHPTIKVTADMFYKDF